MKQGPTLKLTRYMVTKDSRQNSLDKPYWALKLNYAPNEYLSEVEVLLEPMHLEEVRKQIAFIEHNNIEIAKL